MDALKLNLRAKDQLHPLLTEVMSGYAKFKGSAEWEGRAKIIHWCVMRVMRWCSRCVHLLFGAFPLSSFPVPRLTSLRLITLNAMKASDEITEEQSRQMLFDIENAYNEFFRSLSSGN